MTRRDRWVAPTEDGRLLIDPPLDSLHAVLDLNLRRRDHAELFGIPWRDWRQQWHDSEQGRPVIVTGHQPDWVHPGVWVKHFIACAMARRIGGRSIHVSIDTDAAKRPVVMLPRFADDPTQIALESAAYDRWDEEVIWADRMIQDSATFKGFPAEVARVTANWPFRPILTQFWERLSAATPLDQPIRLAEAMDAARRSLEVDWGAGNEELSARRLWEEKAREFLTLLLRDLPRFRDVYNGAVRSYRHRHGLRSRQHPVPELADWDGFLETPCWFVRAGRRSRAFLRRVGEHWEGRVGDIVFPPIRDEGCLIRRIAEAWGFSVYPRALLTTLLLRLFLADIFIHGIGGAKYDEVTDDIIRGYFELEPPEYVVVTGTLRLPFPLFRATVEDRRTLSAKLRALRWHPERFLDHRNDLVEQKERWRSREPLTQAERRARYRELLGLTEALRPLVEPQRLAAERQWERVQRELEANAILTRRDYAWVLHPADRLRNFLTQLT